MENCLDSFPCPCYQKVPLSLALSPRIISAVTQFKPDIIHASTPGVMVITILFFCCCFQCIMSKHMLFSWFFLPTCRCLALSPSQNYYLCRLLCHTIPMFLCMLQLFTSKKFPFMHSLHICDDSSYSFHRYIPRYTFSWLVKPMWLIISRCPVYI